MSQYETYLNTLRLKEEKLCVELEKDPGRSNRELFHLMDNHQKYKDLQEKAENRLLSKIFDLELELGLVKPELIKRYNILKEMKKARGIIKYNNKKDMTMKKNFHWITLNFRILDQQLVANLEETIYIILDKKRFILDYIFNIEQRGETEEDIGYGLHCHILVNVKKNCKPINTGKAIHKDMKKYFSSFGFVKYEPVKRQNYYIKLQEYIRGFKKLEKMKKVIQDRILRRNNKKYDLYFKDKSKNEMIKKELIDEHIQKLQNSL